MKDRKQRSPNLYRDRYLLFATRIISSTSSLQIQKVSSPACLTATPSAKCSISFAITLSSRYNACSIDFSSFGSTPQNLTCMKHVADNEKPRIHTSSHTRLINKPREYNARHPFEGEKNDVKTK